MTREDFIKKLEGYIGVAQGSDVHQAICAKYNSLPAVPRGYKLTVSDPWCAGFASAMWWTFNHQFWFPYECSCTQMVHLAKQEGRFYKDPVIEVGWLVLYDWERDNSPDHVGFITKDDGSTFDVIEGNYSGAVRRRTVSSGSKTIYGTIKLDYSNSEVENAKSFVIKNGIMRGDGTDRYWQNPPTREQLAIILYRYHTKT